MCTLLGLHTTWALQYKHLIKPILFNADNDKDLNQKSWQFTNVSLTSLQGLCNLSHMCLTRTEWSSYQYLTGCCLFSMGSHDYGSKFTESKRNGQLVRRKG